MGKTEEDTVSWPCVGVRVCGRRSISSPTETDHTRRVHLGTRQGHVVLEHACGGGFPFPELLTKHTTVH